MEKAKDSLILFVKSLPAGCKFSIIGFGNNSEFLDVGEEPIIEYNEQNCAEAIERIRQFSANMGVKDIDTPLEMAIGMSEMFDKLQ